MTKVLLEVKLEKSRLSWEKNESFSKFAICFHAISYLSSNVEEEISFQWRMLHCPVFYIQYFLEEELHRNTSRLPPLQNDNFSKFIIWDTD